MATIQIKNLDEFRHHRRGPTNFTEEEEKAINQALDHFRELGCEVDHITFEFKPQARTISSGAFTRIGKIQLSKLFLSELNQIGKVELIKHEIGHIVFRQTDKTSAGHGAAWRAFCVRFGIKMYRHATRMREHQEWTEGGR